MSVMLITGASGMLGKEAMNYFSKYYKVIGTDLYDSDYNADITNKKEIEYVFKKTHPGIVLHCAAMIDVSKCEENEKLAISINDNGTDNIAYLCYKYNSKMIYISTAMIFDGKRKTAYNEKDKENPLNVYSLTKFIGELNTIIQLMYENYIIIRTNIIGNKKGSFIDWLYNKLINNENIDMWGNLYFNSITCKELVKHIHNIIDRKGIYHITSCDSVSKYEFGCKMKKLLKSKSKITKIKYNDSKVKRPLNAVLDCSKYELETGIKLPTIDETIKLIIKELSDG